jgi:hypothetical protein
VFARVAAVTGVDPTATVARCLRRALTDPASLGDLSLPELDLTLRLVRRARMLGRLAMAAADAGVLERLPATARDQLRGAAVLAEARARMARWELDRIGLALDVAGLGGVPVVVLKGSAYLLGGLPNARGRLFSDVDLLVSEQHLDAVERALRSGGWQGKELDPYDDRYYRRWTHELPPLAHPERGVEVDVHHNLLMRTARLRPDAACLFDGARPLQGTRYHTLSPADLVLHAATHLFHGGEMVDALRELVDVADLLGHFGRTEPGFWSGFWPRARQTGLALPAFYALRYAGRCLGVVVPAEVTEAAREASPGRPVLACMDRLVPRGLFPRHPDAPVPMLDGARFALYVRSHWVRMPPPMLARHLAYKAFLRVRGRSGVAGGVN